MSRGLVGRVLASMGAVLVAGPGGRKRLRKNVEAAYREWADRYEDDAARNVAILLERPHIHRLIEPAKGMKILDVGCGTGIHLRGLASTAVGGDRSLPMLLRAKAYAQDASTLSFCCLDAEAGWPFPGQSFDRVLSLLLLAHLHGLGTFYREAARVLVPNGLLVSDAFFWDVDGFEPAEPDLLMRWRLLGRSTYVGHAPLDHFRAANAAGLVVEQIVGLHIDGSVAHALTESSFQRNKGRCIALMMRFRRPRDSRSA